MKKIILLSLFVFFSCALSQEIKTPSGAKGFAITCPAEGLGTGLCYKKAGQKCPQGYKIISQHQTQPAPKTNININGNGNNAQPTEDYTNLEDDGPELTLVIECK